MHLYRVAPSLNVLCWLQNSSMILRWLAPRGRCLKLDISKAYYSVSWIGLERIMESMGFSRRWLDMVRECYATCSFSVLVNGATTSFFKNSNGLRQGDPLSPLLFTFLMEYFFRCMDEMESKGKINIYKVQGCPVMSHLIFAYDALIFREATEKSMKKASKKHWIDLLMIQGCK